MYNNIAPASFLLTIFFFISGIKKLIGFTNVCNGFYKKYSFLGKFISKIVIFLVVVLEILAPILIMIASYGYLSFYGYYSCKLLAIFTILANFMYHYPPTESNYYPFMRNIAIIGGLIALGEHFSLD